MHLLILSFVIFLSCPVGGQERYAVIIQEIMADPSPPVGLPSSEWIEVMNRSKAMVNLQGWRIADNTGISGPMPFYELGPDSILIICGASAAGPLSVFGRTVAVTSFPSLDNDGETIRLTDEAGSTMHAIHYDPGWFANELKQQGGWSLEMIDPSSPCTGKSNWAPSSDPAGGTPGRINSIHASNPDEHPPLLERAYVLSENIIRLVYDEPVDSLKASLLTAYNSSDVRFGEAFPIAPLFNEVELHSLEPMQRGHTYNITASGICDCTGNEAGASEVKAGLPAALMKGSLAINEVLFNPVASGYDYIELVNAGDSVIDLSHGYLANRNSNGDPAGHVPLSIVPRLLFPGEYYVLTGDPNGLALHFFSPAPEVIHYTASMPSFPDDKGTVLVAGTQGDIIDELRYSEKWQFPLIRNSEGVALERIDWLKPSDDPLNWHSASTTSGYGTPGYKNSQTAPAVAGDEAISPKPLVFSPDNDGVDDQCFIYFNLPQPGYVADVAIYNLHGTLTRRLVQGSLLPAAGYWTWDGLDEKGQAISPGPYILLTTVFNLEGKTRKFKSVVVVAR